MAVDIKTSEATKILDTCSINKLMRNMIFFHLFMKQFHADLKQAIDITRKTNQKVYVAFKYHNNFCIISRHGNRRSNWKSKVGCSSLSNKNIQRRGMILIQNFGIQYIYIYFFFDIQWYWFSIGSIEVFMFSPIEYWCAVLGSEKQRGVQRYKWVYEH